MDPQAPSGGDETKQGSGGSSASHCLTLKVSHGLKVLQVQVPTEADFLQLKVALRQQTGIPVEDQTLLFRGRPTNNGDALYAVGVRTGSKLILTESEERRAASASARTSLNTIADLKKQADKLEEELTHVDPNCCRGDAASMKELLRLQEMFERLLLKFDEVSGAGEVRDKRKEQVSRLERLCERIENLKRKCS